MCAVEETGRGVPLNLQVRVQIPGQAVVVTLGDTAAERGGLYGLTDLTMCIWEACWEAFS